MATNPMSEVVQHLRRAGLLRDGSALSDAQLLKDYVGGHDEAALADLVRRHGAMVWNVCRRLLGNYHDAEDAFQATFLVLVRKAASISSRELLANWLYGVAHQTALKARATANKRRAREKQVTEMPEPTEAKQDPWHDLLPLLDQELSRLPSKYRAVIVLCDLQGRTRKEAAGQLGVPEGTIASRMATARAKLAKRLARHIPAVSSAALATSLSQNVASASLPPTVVSSTIKAASVFAAGQAAASGLVSAKVAALTEGVLKIMLLKKLKIACMTLLMAAAAFVGARGLYVYATTATEPAIPQAEAEKQGTKKKPVDEKPVDKSVQEVQLARVDDAELKRREEERRREDVEKTLLEEKKLHDLKRRELVQLLELFGNGDVDVFIDGDTQKPFIKAAKFRGVFEFSGRKFLQFYRGPKVLDKRHPDGKEERLLIDAARIAGLRISE